MTVPLAIARVSGIAGAVWLGLAVGSLLWHVSDVGSIAGIGTTAVLLALVIGVTEPCDCGDGDG